MWQVEFEHKSPAQANSRKAFDCFRGIYVNLDVAIGTCVVVFTDFQTV